MGIEQHIYVDEYGDSNLDVKIKGTTDVYILTAVLIDGTIIPEELTKVRNIIKKYFPNGELKSSSIGKSIDKRIKIFTELNSINFHFYSLVIR